MWRSEWSGTIFLISVGNIIALIDCCSKHLCSWLTFLLGSEHQGSQNRSVCWLPWCEWPGAVVCVHVYKNVSVCVCARAPVCVCMCVHPSSWTRWVLKSLEMQQKDWSYEDHLGFITWEFRTQWFLYGLFPFFFKPESLDLGVCKHDKAMSRLWDPGQVT